MTVGLVAGAFPDIDALAQLADDLAAAALAGCAWSRGRVRLGRADVGGSAGGARARRALRGAPGPRGAGHRDDAAAGLALQLEGGGVRRRALPRRACQHAPHRAAGGRPGGELRAPLLGPLPARGAGRVAPHRALWRRRRAGLGARGPAARGAGHLPLVRRRASAGVGERARRRALRGVPRPALRVPRPQRPAVPLRRLPARRRGTAGQDRGRGTAAGVVAGVGAGGAARAMWQHRRP
jgi:hypothetical protein